MCSLYIATRRWKDAKKDAEERERHFATQCNAHKRALTLNSRSKGLIKSLVFSSTRAITECKHGCDSNVRSERAVLNSSHNQEASGKESEQNIPLNELFWG